MRNNIINRYQHLKKDQISEVIHSAASQSSNQQQHTSNHINNDQNPPTQNKNQQILDLDLSIILHKNEQNPQQSGNLLEQNQTSSCSQNQSIYGPISITSGSHTNIVQGPSQYSNILNQSDQMSQQTVDSSGTVEGGLQSPINEIQNQQNQQNQDHANESLDQSSISIVSRSSLNVKIYFPNVQTPNNQKKGLQQISALFERIMQANKQFERMKYEREKIISACKKDVQNIISVDDSVSEQQKQNSLVEKIVENSSSSIYHSQLNTNSPNAGIPVKEIGKYKQLKQDKFQLQEESHVRIFDERYEWVVIYGNKIEDYLSIQRAYYRRSRMHEREYHDLDQYGDYSIEYRREMLNRSCPDVRISPVSNYFMQTHKNRLIKRYLLMLQQHHHDHNHDSPELNASRNASIISLLADTCSDAVCRL